VIKVGIVGATGYTGAELLRILSGHCGVSVEVITSRAESGRRVSELYPSLRGVADHIFEAPDASKLKSLDVVFFATPHGVAQSMMSEIAGGKAVVIDLSADFRIRDRDTWESWYGQAHGAPELIGKAVYGLAEVNRSKIASANLIACPGCYPTSIQLALKPLLEAGLIETRGIIANSASGVTGAGRSASVATLFTEVNDSYKAYGVSGHRHLPEIEQGLSDIASEPVSLTFVPHLVPMSRGILSTVYVRLRESANENLQSVFEQSYQNEMFVDVLPAGLQPETRSVKGSNMCRIAVSQSPDPQTVVITSAIDNLCKGAAGQAVQCMNIRFGFNENAGLELPALMP